MATVGNFQWLIQLARAHMSCNKPSNIERFQLWVDGVGGFLVCRSPRVRIGQAVPGSDLEVPLVADVSRHHATIARDAEGYVVEPVRSVRIADKAITQASPLADGDVITLGAVKLRFRRPHPLSSTARLEHVSRHQTQPPASAILLMSETCVLGSQPASHVVCRNWPGNAVLFERDNRLYVRPVEVKSRGRAGAKPIPLAPGIPAIGDYFSISIEEI